jgi:drug/metabolite transporter superfamily protein YnfA
MLIPEGFSGWWKKYSAAALAAIVAIQGAWKMSADMQTLLPKDWLDTATLILAVLGFIGRFIAQTQTQPTKEDPP